MFSHAYRAEPEIGSWDVGNVINMSGMFYDALANPDVSSWDMGSVVDMSAMFRGASSATPDVSRWDVSQVIDMGYVFKFASRLTPTFPVGTSAKPTICARCSMVPLPLDQR